jgi:AcrR family transcriptional regulator
MSQTAANREEEEALEAAVVEAGPGIVTLPGTDTDADANPSSDHPADPDDDAPPPEAASIAPAEETTPNTRDRILDIALELFTEQGFDATSLRQIAERLGVTKAALYYHFESKDDILMALHMRLHEFGRNALSRMGEEPVTLELWEELLDEIVDQMLAQRQLFLMHQRNQAVLEKLHREEHDAEHEDIEEQFRRLLGDTRMPLRDRVRMAASFGVLFSGLFLTGEAFADSDNAELGGLLREAVHDVLRG